MPKEVADSDGVSNIQDGDQINEEEWVDDNIPSDYDQNLAIAVEEAKAGNRVLGKLLSHVQTWTQRDIDQGERAQTALTVLM